MIYTLEYLNENAEVEILRYDSDKRRFQIVASRGHSLGYEDPDKEWVYVCRETTEETSATEFDEQGIYKVWSNRIGEFRPEIADDEGGFERTDGVTFIRSMVSGDSVAMFMTSLIEQMAEHEGKGNFCHDFDMRKKVTLQ